MQKQGSRRAIGPEAAKHIADWLCNFNKRASRMFSIYLIQYLFSDVLCCVIVVRIFTHIGSHNAPKKGYGSRLRSFQRSC